MLGWLNRPRRSALAAKFARRHTRVFREGDAERARRLVACAQRNLFDVILATRQGFSGKRHPPEEQVLHGRHADGLAEGGEKSGAGHRALSGEMRDLPVSTGLLMDEMQGGGDFFVL